MAVVEISHLIGLETEHLDETVVEDYAARIDELPPVVVFATPEGLLLADGHHRVAAALRAGRDSVKAEVRPGTRADALAFAVENAARRGVTPEEAREAIRRWGGEGA